MLYFMGCMFFSNFSCQPYVINIQVRNTDNISTDLYILLKPQSQLGYLGFNGEYLLCPDNALSPSRADASIRYGCIKPLIILTTISLLNNTLPLALAVHEITRHFWAAYGGTDG